jgi:ppGpp synthetase/RelA/SpoT-type nucleotidyltranferase
MIKEENIVREFNQLKVHLKEWGKMVDNHIMGMIKQFPEGKYFLKIHPKYRLKTDLSYKEKALYRKKEYTNPIIDIEDKIGTRIVLLKSTDIDLISTKILESNFWNSKVTKSRTNEIEDKPTIFDYQSQHIVVWPKTNCGFNKEILTALTCEIQIRTLLQHAFAEVSHDSTYKGPYKNDAEIIRQLSKSMALMEATDDYFCKIFEIMKDETRRYSNYLKELNRIYTSEFLKKGQSTQISYELSDSLISLLDVIDIPISSIETFVIQEKDCIKALIKANNHLFLSQPIFLFLYYIMFNHRSVIENQWPLNSQSLNDFKNLLGISSNDY